MTVGFKVELTHDPSEGEESVKRSGATESIFMIWHLFLYRHFLPGLTLENELCLP